VRNYKPQLELEEFPEKMRELGVAVLPTDNNYCAIRGILLMLAEENKHHRKAIDKLQIEVDELKINVTALINTLKEMFPSKGDKG